jgi:ribosome-binding factor A
MQSKRCTRVGEMLKEEISQIIRTRLNDPRVGFVTLTDVVVSKDLRYAKVFVSVMGAKETAAQSIAALEGAHAFIQGELSGRIKMRFLPVLSFHLDDSWENHARIDQLLHEIEIERESVDKHKT